VRKIEGKSQLEDLRVNGDIKIDLKHKGSKGWTEFNWIML
jgi:hypothetical protein